MWLKELFNAYSVVWICSNVRDNHINNNNYNIFSFSMIDLISCIALETKSSQIEIVIFFFHVVLCTFNFNSLSGQCCF